MICNEIKQLVNYAVRNGLIAECDRNYAINSLLSVLCIDTYEDTDYAEEKEL
jgi:galactose-1-phosphate uridylyltransferase